MEKAIGAMIAPDQVWPLFLEGAAVIITIMLLLYYAHLVGREDRR